MSNMFNSAFSASPLVQGMNMNNQMEFAMMQARQVAPQQMQRLPIDKVSESINSLSQDEKALLVNSQSFVAAKSYYDSAFMEFLGAKYKQEFASTQIGSQAAQNLLDTTNGVINQVREQSRSERERISKLSRLLEENPNLLNELEAKKNGKGTK